MNILSLIGSTALAFSILGKFILIDNGVRTAGERGVNEAKCPKQFIILDEIVERGDVEAHD
jgi:hypothetical protein